MISVLINNYNYERYIAEAIESVLAQTFEDFELIIVDDGSTDGSRAVIDQFDDPRIQKVYKENGGQATAFNVGWERARGKYVAFLDSDDRWSPNKLERVWDILEGQEGVAVLQHWMRIIDGEGRPVDREAFGAWIPSGTFDMKKIVLRTHTPPLITATSGMVVAKSAMDPCFPLNEDWRISADAAMVARGVNCGNYLYLAESLTDYRVHGTNFFAGRQGGVGDPKAEDHLRRLTEELNATSCDGAIDFAKSAYGLRQRISRWVPGAPGRALGKAMVRFRRNRALEAGRIDRPAPGAPGERD